MDPREPLPAPLWLVLAVLLMCVAAVLDAGRHHTAPPPLYVVPGAQLAPAPIEPSVSPGPRPGNPYDVAPPAPDATLAA